MSLTITLNADTPEDLIRMLRTLNTALGAEADRVSDRITRIDFGVNPAPGAGPLIADVGLAQPAPTPTPTPPPPAPDTANTPTVNVAVPPDNLTPAEMRQKGSDLLMQFFNRDPAGAQPHLVAVQKKFGVKKFDAVPDDRARDFYTDAVLISNGTGAAAAS